MLKEIERYVVHLRTGDRVQPGVQSKFAEFHRWALGELRAELRWEPRPGFRQIVGADGKLEDTDEPLPPSPIRSEQYLAWEALLVALATIPRLPAVDRRSRADEILAAVGGLEALLVKPTEDKPKRGRPSKDVQEQSRGMFLAAIHANPSMLDHHEQLAAQIGVSVRTVRRWCSDQKTLNLRPQKRPAEQRCQSCGDPATGQHNGKPVCQECQEELLGGK
jgi:hypothetical protein